MTDVQTGLNSLLKELKHRDQLPKKMDAAKVGNRYWFVCHDQDESNIISEDSTTGFSEDPNIALLKALAERVERSAFRQGYSSGLRSCMTPRSDGFAAYPSFSNAAVSKARESAYCEAVERLAWATWWDNSNVAYDADPINTYSNKYGLEPYVNVIAEQCEIEEIFVIQPKIENSEDISVLILIARLKGGGFISGGAGGLLGNFKMNLLRSLDELYRHGLAIKKMKNKNTEPISFYERRLAYFGLGFGDQIVLERLETKGNAPIILPPLEIDELVSHDLEDLFHVHRCYFQNQPAFVGGALERLCL